VFLFHSFFGHAQIGPSPCTGSKFQGAFGKMLPPATSPIPPLPMPQLTVEQLKHLLNGNLPIEDNHRQPGIFHGKGAATLGLLNNQEINPAFSFNPEGVPVTNPTTYPYYTNGQFRFQFRDEIDYLCSGAMIYTNLFITAAHCVYNASHGGWITGGEFYLPFIDNSNYRWTANYWIVPCAFIVNQSFAYDWAIVNTTRTNAFPGYIGSSWNQSPQNGDIYQSLGYPGGNPTMMTQNLEYITTYQNGSDPELSGMLMGKDNTFTPGASGGPWWRTPWTNSPYGNGLNSNWLPATPGVHPDYMLSPYFDTMYDIMFTWFRSHGGA